MGQALYGITAILSDPSCSAEAGQAGSKAKPENTGEAVVQDSEDPDGDAESTTAIARADWMQRAYERFFYVPRPQSQGVRREVEKLTKFTPVKTFHPHLATEVIKSILPDTPLLSVGRRGGI